MELKGRTLDVAVRHDPQDEYGVTITPRAKLTSVSYSSRQHWDWLVPEQCLEYEEIFWMKWTRRKAFMG